MTWVNPFALAGLALVALPILIHMMARARARELRFPTLRFVEGTRQQPARRTRLQDIPLLLLRAAALVAAAIAVAGPMILAAPPAGADGTIARAVVVDRSASMRRQVAGGSGPAIVAASSIGDSLVRSATAVGFASTTDPGAELAGAAAWALSRPGRAEVVVVSDFQVGSVDSADIAALPAGVGVSFRKIAVRPGPASIQRRSVQGGDEAVARAAFVTGGTSVEYISMPRALRDPEIEILASVSDRAGVSAARAAAATIGVDAPDSGAIAPADRPVVIAFAGYESRDSLISASTAPVEYWQAELAARALRDPLLASMPPVAVRSLKRGRIHPLLFVASVAPATPEGVAMIAAVSRARSAAVPASELEPATIPDSTLASWTREAAPRVAGESGSSSDLPPASRWLWIVALLLLGAEALLRRSSLFAHRALTSTTGANDPA